MILEVLRETGIRAVDVDGLEYQQEIYGDIQADKKLLSDGYRNAVLPDHVKEQLARKRKDN